jgi:hypothetical protein
MRRALVLLPLVLLAAACGGKSSAPPTTTSLPQPGGVLGSSGRTLYNGGDWAVVTQGTRVAVTHLVAGRWSLESKSNVKISILGPQPLGKVAAIPQVAVELKAPSALVEDGLWVDGKELLEKGGGLHANDQTIYGAPDTKLAKGVHVAIAYGRTASSGAAVRWTFTVV